MLVRLLLTSLLLALSACTSLPGADEPVSTEPPELGQCRLLDPADIAEASSDAAPVPCEDKHSAETFAVGTFSDQVAAGGLDDPALGAALFEECERKFRDFLGGDESLVMRATVTWAWFRPSEAAWDAGARWWRCDVVGGGEESTELIDLPATVKGILLGQPDDRWMACVNGPDVADAVKIPCSEKHTWRAATTIVLGKESDPYPGDDVIQAKTQDFCSESVGAWLGYPVDYDYGYSFFHEAEWEAGNRRSICWARTTK